jgi:hypothetical protein
MPEGPILLRQILQGGRKLSSLAACSFLPFREF